MSNWPYCDTRPVVYVSTVVPGLQDGGPTTGAGGLYRGFHGYIIVLGCRGLTGVIVLLLI